MRQRKFNPPRRINEKELASNFVWMQVTTGSNSFFVLNGMAPDFLDAFLSMPNTEYTFDMLPEN